MLRKIYQELVLIRKELQSMNQREFNKFLNHTEYKPKSKVVRKNGKAIRVPIDYDNSSNTEL